MLNKQNNCRFALDLNVGFYFFLDPENQFAPLIYQIIIYSDTAMMRPMLEQKSCQHCEMLFTGVFYRIRFKRKILNVDSVSSIEDGTWKGEVRKRGLNYSLFGSYSPQKRFFYPSSVFFDPVSDCQWFNATLNNKLFETANPKLKTPFPSRSRIESWWWEGIADDEPPRKKRKLEIHCFWQKQNLFAKLQNSV